MHNLLKLQADSFSILKLILPNFSPKKNWNLPANLCCRNLLNYSLSFLMSFSPTAKIIQYTFLSVNKRWQENALDGSDDAYIT